MLQADEAGAERGDLKRSRGTSRQPDEPEAGTILWCRSVLQGQAGSTSMRSASLPQTWPAAVVQGQAPCLGRLGDVAPVAGRRCSQMPHTRGIRPQPAQECGELGADRLWFGLLLFPRLPLGQGSKYAGALLLLVWLLLMMICIGVLVKFNDRQQLGVGGQQVSKGNADCSEPQPAWSAHTDDSSWAAVATWD